MNLTAEACLYIPVSREDEKYIIKSFCSILIGKLNTKDYNLQQL